MRNPKNIFHTSPTRIYCFADSVNICRVVLEAGARIVQLRNKALDDRAFRNLACQMLAVVRKFENAVLIVNDRVDIALECAADGVHVGQEDEDYRSAIGRLPDHLIVGVSARYPETAQEAAQAGATYVGAGAVYATGTKSNVPVIGLAGLRSVVEAVSIPVVAIGGISAATVCDVLETGARYAAVISEITGAPNPAEAYRSLEAAARLSRK
jgi:thiamine-phosphate pyrophosphorylase